MPAITCNFQFYIVLHKGGHRNKMLFFFMALLFSDLLIAITYCSHATQKQTNNRTTKNITAVNNTKDSCFNNYNCSSK